MIDALENIKSAIEVSIIALSTLFLVMVAPGEAFGWLKKILILTLVLQIFALFVPSLEGFQVFMMYVMNLAPYKMFPESSWIFIQQMFVLFVTWQILLWVVGKQHTNSNESMPRAEGFTTRSL